MAGSNRDETSPCGLLDESHLTGQQNSLDTNVIARKPAPKAKFQVSSNIKALERIPTAQKMTLPSVEPEFTKPATILASFTEPLAPHHETVEELKSLVVANSEKLAGLNFSGINLSEAKFRVEEDIRMGADLRGTDLTYARNLTQDQLNSAIGDDTMNIPSRLVRPSHWTAEPDQ